MGGMDYQPFAEVVPAIVGSAKKPLRFSPNELNQLSSLTQS